MPRFRMLWVLGVFAAIAAAQAPSGTLYAQNYGKPVCSPQPVGGGRSHSAQRNLTRIENLAGKKIGVFVNYKRAARPIGLSLEKRLKSMYPGF